MRREKEQKSTKCPICKRRMVRLLRVSEEAGLTKNETWVCVNPQCPLYVNLKKVRNWIEASNVEVEE